VKRDTDLAAIEALARAAPAGSGPAWSAAPARDGAVAGARIAIARGPAFSFHYEENLELLAAAGADLEPFDPLHDEALPADCGGLLLAGGFPEVFGEQLAANAPLREQIAAFAAAGMPILAECGGLLYLCRELDGHAMCDALAATARMTDRLKLGYREAVAATATPWIDAGEPVRGHEFHYSTLQPLDAARPAWELSTRGILRFEGVVAGALQASFLHVHWAAHPQLALRFARAAGAAARLAAA
jgi:cobyrinic acid a,c-diamide synthase